MAKDNIGLLNEISASLRQMNMAQVRQNLENQAYQKQQLTVSAGGNVQQDAQFIDPGEDFKRRVKSGLFTAKIGEKFTESGERAKRSNKEAKKLKKFNKVLIRDKRVGLGTIVDAVKEGPDGETNRDSGWAEVQLMKVNTDAIVQMLGGIRKHLGMSNKATEKARKKKIDAIKNAARAAAEAAREKKKESQDKAKKGGKVDVAGMKKPSARGAGFAALFLRIAAIPLLLVGWAVAGVTAVV